MRRLGVGRGGGGGDRPLRAQLVVALVVVLILIAVPLYLWRRPGASQTPSADSPDASPDAASVADGAAADGPDSGAGQERVTLSPVQRVRCSASPTGHRGAVCDPLPFFDQALAKAIRDNVDCAPRTGKTGTINYVLTINFTSRQLHVFPGQSGEWKGPQARRAAACVKKSLKAPDWEAIQHQYRYYQLAILATYPAPTAAPLPGPPGAPVFE